MSYYRKEERRRRTLVSDLKLTSTFGLRSEITDRCLPDSPPPACVCLWSSGKCQIIHWRHIHKNECQPLENNGSSSKLAYAGGPAQDQSLFNENVSKQFIDGHPEKPFQRSTYYAGNFSTDVDA